MVGRRCFPILRGVGGSGVRPIDCVNAIREIPRDDMIQTLFYMCGYRPALMSEVMETIAALRAEGTVECTAKYITARMTETKQT